MPAFFRLSVKILRSDRDGIDKNQRQQAENRTDADGYGEIFARYSNDEMCIRDRIYTMDWTDRQSGIGTEVEIEDQRLYAKENRLLVSYDKVPKYLVDAYVATEDHRFWNHPGVDWIRTIRAALNYFLGNSFGGASTITQQVVKNITQDDDCLLYTSRCV